MLTRAEKERVTKVKEFASRNRCDKEKVFKILTGKLKPVGDDPRYACALKLGKNLYRCVFSFEEQPHGWCRHLSVSAKQGRLRTPEVNALLRVFDFRAELFDFEKTVQNKNLLSWLETIDGVKILNVLESVEEQPEEPARSIQKIPGTQGAYIIQEPPQQGATP